QPQRRHNQRRKHGFLDPGRRLHERLGHEQHKQDGHGVGQQRQNSRPAHASASAGRAPIRQQMKFGVGGRLDYSFHPASKDRETISECSSILSSMAKAVPSVSRAAAPDPFGNFRLSTQSRKASSCNFSGSPAVTAAFSKPICRFPLTEKTIR